MTGVDGILEYGASLIAGKMMERRKHRSESGQFNGNVSRVNRVRMEKQMISRRFFDKFGCAEVWIFIGEENVKVLRVAMELLRKVQPRASAARTEIDN